MIGEVDKTDLGGNGRARAEEAGAEAVDTKASTSELAKISSHDSKPPQRILHALLFFFLLGAIRGTWLPPWVAPAALLDLLLL